MLVETPLIELRNVAKRFGGVQALADINLRVMPGQVHGLVGENGAGKSTLGKLLAGLHQPETGEILVDGRVVHYRSPVDALADGLTIIAQELALVPRLSVLDNVFLGVESARWGVVDRAALRRRYAELARLGLDVPPELPVGRLAVAQQQKVEILRAIARKARVIVMDEPTASLTVDETTRLLHIVRVLRDQGTTIILVSHFLDDVLGVCDTITVLRDGRLVKTAPARTETPRSLVLAMVGRQVDVTFPPKTRPAPDAPVLFEARGITLPHLVTDVSLSVRRGEIVGLAGLIGSGRSETARAIFGANKMVAGTLWLDGVQVVIRNPRSAIEHGIALLPEDRKHAGLVMGRSLIDNVTLPHLEHLSTAGIIDRAEEHNSAGGVLKRLDVRAGSLRQSVRSLSGGNQQKTLFGKWLFKPPRLLIADEPTRGVDVGAKRAIYELLVALARQGLAILLISSELEEVIGLGHRIYVMRSGRVVAEVDPDQVRGDYILQLAFGGQDDPETQAPARGDPPA